jgi:hypothetical protein
MSGDTHFERRRRALPAILAILALVLAACAPLDTDDDTDTGDEPSTPAESSAESSADATAADSGDDGGDGGDMGDGGDLTIATGGTGGVYYVLGGGLATVIGDSVEGYSASASETNASVDNMQLIADGGADIAFSLGDTAADAVNGTGDFEGDPVSACALAQLYDNYTQLVSSTDAGITSIDDLRGARVSLGSPGSGTEIIALRMLEVAGIDPDADIDRQQLGVDETVAALRDGTIDAGFWSGGLPTGALTEYATSGDMVIVPTADTAAGLQEAYGDFYAEGEIPAGTYDGQDDAVPTVVVPNVLVVNTDMPEGLQEALTATVFDNRDALIDVHPAAEELDEGTAGDIAFMEVCPGSQRYFGE